MKKGRVHSFRHLLSRAVLIVAGAAALGGCGQTASTTPQEPDASADAPAPGSLLSAHETLVEALIGGDVAGVVALLETEPPPLVFHPRVDARFEGVEEIRSGLEQMVAVTGPLGWTEVHGEVTQEGAAGWLTYHVLVESERMGEVVAARATEAWRYEEGAWRLAHVHWSELDVVTE